MNAFQPQAAQVIEAQIPSLHQERPVDSKVKSCRINGEELAQLQQELQTGERTCLGANESRELVEEIRFLRWQLQRIRLTRDSDLQSSIAQEALYGERTTPVVLSVHSG